MVCKHENADEQRNATQRAQNIGPGSGTTSAPAAPAAPPTIPAAPTPAAPTPAAPAAPCGADVEQPPAATETTMTTVSAPRTRALGPAACRLSDVPSS